MPERIPTIAEANKERRDFLQYFASVDAREFVNKKYIERNLPEMDREFDFRKQVERELKDPKYHTLATYLFFFFMRRKLIHESHMEDKENMIREIRTSYNSFFSDKARELLGIEKKIFYGVNYKSRPAFIR